MRFTWRSSRFPFCLLRLLRLLCGKLVEECSDGEEVDELETCYEREAEEQAQQASEGSEHSEPVLVHVFAIVRCDQVVEENMHQGLIGEIDVFEEAQRVLRELSDERTGRDLRRISEEGAIGIAEALLPQQTRRLRRVVPEGKDRAGESSPLRSHALQLLHLALGVRPVVGKREGHTPAELIDNCAATLGHAVNVRITPHRIHCAFIGPEAVAALRRQVEHIIRRVGGLWMLRWKKTTRCFWPKPYGVNGRSQWNKSILIPGEMLVYASARDGTSFTTEFESA